MKMIWIDMDNSPHVPFFVPIIRELEKRGYSFIVTARDAFQVRGLADKSDLNYVTVGRHYGSNKLLKVLGTIWRSFQLMQIVSKYKLNLSISHGSRSLMIASAILRIPNVLLFDYEHAEALPFIKPELGIAPDVVDDQRLAKRFRRGIRAYHGLKEDVYVSTFKPDPAILVSLGIKKEELVVTIRPPATEAHYHNPESERLFFAVVELLGNYPDVRIVMLPRNAVKQKNMIKSTWPDWCKERRIIIPEEVVDGLNLIWHSDFVVSGGGTMNREAASLGVPVYSIFRGKIGAVDRYLAEKGQLILLESAKDVRSKMKPMRRIKKMESNFGDRVALGQIVAAIEDVVQTK